MRSLIRQWFLLALAVVLAVGFFACGPLAGIADATRARNGIVALVLFMMALPLETGAMWRALRRPGPALLGVVLNFGVLPIIAWALAPLLGGDLGIGLVVTVRTCIDREQPEIASITSICPREPSRSRSRGLVWC